MSQSNVENLRKQYENYSDAAKAEFTFSQKLQGAIDEINTWKKNDSDNGGSNFGSGFAIGYDYNDNNNGNYDDDNGNDD